ncbi:MAG: T9SS C-terminal target domain-containing protein [Bacteroidota bacterium]
MKTLRNDIFFPILLFFFPLSTFLFAQYPPPAGQTGSTAIFADSAVFINWAKECTVQLGYVNMEDTSVYYAGSNKADYGTTLDALEKADGHVISLGDHGVATLTFNPPVTNGIGFDFAVFENGLNDSFLELAFVEVSSDGIRFVRFPAVSLTQFTAQVATFGTIDATQINNFAGKYRVLFGTPFDLNELKDSSGIDITKITHIRILDVGGSINLQFASYDSHGHIINDPFPTPFNTGGFDLDAIGVIHENTQSVGTLGNIPAIRIFPNPVEDFLRVQCTSTEPVNMKIWIPGNLRSEFEVTFTSALTADITLLPAGFYIASFLFPDGRLVNQKIIKR